MRVAIEDEGDESTITVYLDTGEEIGKYCVADDPRAEAAAMREMLVAVRTEEAVLWRVNICEPLTARTAELAATLATEKADRLDAELREFKVLAEMGRLREQLTAAERRADDLMRIAQVAEQDAAELGRQNALMVKQQAAMMRENERLRAELLSITSGPNPAASFALSEGGEGL